jgi:hypothetical protein
MQCKNILQDLHMSMAEQCCKCTSQPAQVQMLVEWGMQRPNAGIASALWAVCYSLVHMLCWFATLSVLSAAAQVPE